MTGARRALRWVKRIVLGTLLLAVVTVTTVVIVLHTEWGRRKALALVMPMLQKKFPGGISAERLDGSVLGDITLVGVRINGFDKKQMIHIARAQTNVKLLSLFSRTVELEYVEAWDVQVDDPSNPVTPSTDDDLLPVSVELPGIKVHNITLRISGAQPMTFEKGELELSMSVSSSAEIDATITKFDAYWKERAMPVHVEAQAKVGAEVKIPRLLAVLDGTRVEGTGIVVDSAQPSGKLVMRVTPEVLASIVPGVTLPAPADITLNIAPAGKELRIDLEAKMGSSSVSGALLGVIADRKVRGMITASAINLETFVPQLTGYGDGVLAFVVDGTAATAHVLALTRGKVLDFPAGHAMIDLTANMKEARAIVIAGGAGGVGAAVIGRLVRDGDKLDLVDARVAGTAHDADVATGGQAPFKGIIKIGGTAHGSILPKLALDLDGYVNARALVATDPKLRGVSIERLDGRGDAKITEDGTFSHLHATATNVRRAGAPLGTFEVDARNRRDGKISAHVTARPAALPSAVAEFDVLVSLGKHQADPITIALGKHSLRANRIVWAGSGGSIKITDKNVEIRDVRSTSDKASLVLDATVNKLSGALEIKLDATNVPASMIDPRYLGTFSARADLERRGLRWDGKANVQIDGLALGPNQPVIEGAVGLTIAGRRVIADVTAKTFQVGGVRLVIDVEGPRDITDVIGWRRLERKAIKTAMLGVTRIDLAAAKVKTGGIVDGELVISGMDTSGTFTIKDVQTPLGVVEGNVNFAPMGDELGVSSTLKVEDIGEVQVAAQIAIPPHPFEPDEWKRLGRGVVRLLTATVDDLEVDPAKLAKLGIKQPYSGRVSMTVALAAGAGEARVKLDVRDIRGGILQKPAELHLEATIDPKNTSAIFVVSGNNKPFVNATAKLPGFGFDRWVDEADKVIDAPIEGKLELPNIEVVDLLAMFGRAEITSGKLGGEIVVAGTAAKPTADANLIVTNVNVKPRLAGRKLPTLTELKITGKWDGATGTVAINGTESDGATLDITASGRPDKLEDLQAKVDIRKFDIAPIAVFLPGPLVAATGKIGAKIVITGLSPDKIRGTLALEKAQVPIHPKIGTVRDANVSIKLTELGLAYNVDAKLGAGTLKLKGSAPKDLSRIEVEGSVDKLSLIGEIQPIVSAKIDGTLFREENLLRGDMTLSRASVMLDMEQGVRLLESEMPDDLFLGRTTPPPPVAKQLRIPRKPWIVMKVKLHSTPIKVKHEYFEVRARASSPRGITVSIGRQLGMDGSIEIERGDVDVLGRHYRVDPGPDKVRFDGTIDPLLGIRLVHEFPELTLTADLVGRASKKEIRMSGTPALYSQDQLFAFFLGGDPSGDASSATRDAASSVGSALVSAKLARQAKKVLPFRIDTFNCDAGTSASSSGCKLGRWLTQNWFVAYKQRLEPRADENPQEVQLQYYFKKNWVLEGAGFLERFGGDVLWRKRW
ncbi:MAG: translocation/assembly module TamB domain-containing protein [Myxococcota bacterium]|nr:translocation/assembly module TamB domain-containing protein [Myxococcota bacterium]